MRVILHLFICKMLIYPLDLLLLDNQNKLVYKIISININIFMRHLEHLEIKILIHNFGIQKKKILIELIQK